MNQSLFKNKFNIIINLYNKILNYVLIYYCYDACFILNDIKKYNPSSYLCFNLDKS